ncbi:MAG: hypothetical protein ACP5U0_08100 [Caldisphaera sp.]
MIDFNLISKSTGVGLLSGVITTALIPSILSFVPVFMIGFSAVYYMGRLNQRIINIENSIKLLEEKIIK